MCNLLIVLITLYILPSTSRITKTVTVDSPCLPDLRAESLKYIGLSGPAGTLSYIYSSCYKSVPDNTSRLISMSTHTECYIPHAHFYQIFQGEHISRCGSCIEITGPSLKTASCTVVGSFKMNFSKEDNNSNALIHSSERTIFVNDQLFHFYSGYTEEGNIGSALPIVARFVDCPYKTFPTAIITQIVEEKQKNTENAFSMENKKFCTQKCHIKNKEKIFTKVFKKIPNKEIQKRFQHFNNTFIHHERIKENTSKYTFNENSYNEDTEICVKKCLIESAQNNIKKSTTQYAKIALYNTNQIVSKIIYNNQVFHINEDTMEYTIPLSSLQSNSNSSVIKKHLYLKIYDLFWGHTNIPFKFIENTDFVSNSLTTNHFLDTKCYLRPNPGFTPNEKYEDPYMVWSLRVHDKKDLSKSYQVNGSVINFESELYISVNFPFPIKLSKHYKTFFASLSVNIVFLELPTFEFYTHFGDVTQLKRVNCSREFVMNRTASIQDGLIHIENTAAFNIARCNAATNLLMMHYKTGKNTTMYIKSLTFTDVNDLNYTKCTLNDYMCTLEDECDARNSTIDSEDNNLRTYVDGCVPLCGVCSGGYVCNKAARCVPLKYHNTRSYSTTVLVLLIVIIVMTL
ncbi:hypothetical protein EIN_291290 [Entamoeba invadens IP1]|uniref:Uncharacterized protein n=1 Tax=Entamoeba invadens IP1 TaxID=370355 RepID=A0A0A1UAN4_ENTIV|nr:hypothetical protein EIN_291290 [Entamoeba invadens IP1]ELP92030.1 hypothetical protein EIN_291290 [Entamoeba invadens IP1]|eukprot:XP_004258801.1 hypothetical protein EIN_291290 [Entamoeba invadens IP1]